MKPLVKIFMEHYFLHEGVLYTVSCFLFYIHFGVFELIDKPNGR